MSEATKLLMALARLVEAADKALPAVRYAADEWQREFGGAGTEFAAAIAKARKRWESPRNRSVPPTKLHRCNLVRTRFRSRK